MTQPKLLGRYTILRELGRGAIGAVCAAQDQTTGARVALKTLDPALLGAADASLAERFLKNARSAARLRHANIVQVHDAGQAGGTAWVAMELVEGESLRRLLERAAAVHRARGAHLRRHRFRARLCPRGRHGAPGRQAVEHHASCLRARRRSAISAPGRSARRPARYMSPEQVRGNPLDARSDLFSLGAVFYEMLTRRAPFTGNSPQEIKQRILHAEPPPPSELNPLVPEALDRMVLGLLTLRPDGRPASARILLRDLHRVEEGLGLGASIDVAPTSRPQPCRTSGPNPANPRSERHRESARCARAAAASHPASQHSTRRDFGGFRPGAAEADVLPDRP